MQYYAGTEWTHDVVNAVHVQRKQDAVALASSLGIGWPIQATPGWVVGVECTLRLTHQGLWVATHSRDKATE